MMMEPAMPLVGMGDAIPRQCYDAELCHTALFDVGGWQSRIAIDSHLLVVCSMLSSCQWQTLSGRCAWQPRQCLTVAQTCHAAVPSCGKVAEILSGHVAVAALCAGPSADVGGHFNHRYAVHAAHRPQQGQSTHCGAAAAVQLDRGGTGGVHQGVGDRKNARGGEAAFVGQRLDRMHANSFQTSLLVTAWPWR